MSRCCAYSLVLRRVLDALRVHGEPSGDSKLKLILAVGSSDVKVEAIAAHVALVLTHTVYTAPIEAQR